MITVVGGIKGGTGKTTLATNLAVISMHLGKRTLLIDADDQKSASDWADQREVTLQDKESVGFPTICLGGRMAYLQIQKMKDNYDNIIVDTGGRDTESQRSALTIADCYLVPFKPRSFDVWTIGKVQDLVEKTKIINPNIRVIVCINQADSKGTDNEEALKILSEIPDFKCATCFIGHRKAFSNAAAQGLGVFELDKDAKAKDELMDLHRVVYQ